MDRVIRDIDLLFIADTIRDVTAKVQEELESGRRSARIDAHDLIEVLLAIAEAIDKGCERGEQ